MDRCKNCIQKANVKKVIGTKNARGHCKAFTAVKETTAV